MPEESDVQFRDKYLLRELLRKYPAFDLGIETRLAAKTSFYEDETVNSATNDRLLSEVPSSTTAQVLCLARKKIAEILGQFSEAEFWQGWRFGPKSTSSLRYREATVENKLQLGTPAATLEALPLFRNLLQNEPGWSYCMSRKFGGETHWIDCSGDKVPHDGVKIVEHLTRICQFDRWTSVRKNAKTDRGIGIPPDGNIAMQLSVGKMIRRRLHDVGVDLSDQTRNQVAALRASLKGDNATVDVRGASQSVTCGLVWNLIGSQDRRELDWRWFWVLEALRTPFTLVDGDMHENEVFSMMGNGYTFELESLVFYALAWACTSFLHEDVDAVSVYGDDIILPVGSYDLLVEVFDFCGFRINEDKSYHSIGDYRFRESCGKHYLNGVDVTPFYVDSPLDNPATIILAANNLVRWAVKPGHRDGRVFPVWVYLVAHLGPGYLDRKIPLGEANDGLIVDWDECCPPSVWLKGVGGMPHTHSGWKVKTVAYEPRPTALDDLSRYLRWLYNTSGRTGFKPPAVPKLGGKEFSTWFPSGWLKVEPSLKTAPEVARSIAAKASLQLSSRVVTSWPWLGPWVSDDFVIEQSDVELFVRLRSAHIVHRRFPVMGKGYRPARPGKKRRSS